MRTRVTAQGLLIPKEWLRGVVEVDIRQENNQIIIVPVQQSDDPLLRLGSEPIRMDITDASTNHDHYLAENS
jgi:virulence-associated protein VagC